MLWQNLCNSWSSCIRSGHLKLLFQHSVSGYGGWTKTSTGYNSHSPWLVTEDSPHRSPMSCDKSFAKWTMSFAMQMTARASAKPAEMIQHVCVCLWLCMCIWLQNVEKSTADPVESYWHSSMARNTSMPSHKRNAGRSIKIPSLPWCLFLKQCSERCWDSPIVIRSLENSQLLTWSSIRSRGRSPPAIDISDIQKKTTWSGHLVLDHSKWAARSKNGTPMEEALSPQGWIRCLSATSQDVCASCLPVESYHYRLYHLYISLSYSQINSQKIPITFQSSLVISFSPDLFGIEPNTSSRSPDC